jgi:hypothetical protein
VDFYHLLKGSPPVQVPLSYTTLYVRPSDEDSASPNKKEGKVSFDDAVVEYVTFLKRASETLRKKKESEPLGWKSNIPPSGFMGVDDGPLIHTPPDLTESGIGLKLDLYSYSPSSPASSPMPKRRATDTEYESPMIITPKFRSRSASSSSSQVPDVAVEKPRVVAPIIAEVVDKDLDRTSWELHEAFG